MLACYIKSNYLAKWAKWVKICITQSHSDSPKHFIIFPCWFSLPKFSVSPFRTNRVLTALQTYCKYLSGGIYRYCSWLGFSKWLRFCTGFCREEFSVSSKPYVFKRHCNNHTETSLILWSRFKPPTARL